MKTETKSSDDLPLHSEIDRIIASKSGNVLRPVDVETLAIRRHPLAQGLMSLCSAERWSPTVFDIKLIDHLPAAAGARLKIELMKLAVSRNDLAYIAEAVVVGRHKFKVTSGPDSSSRQVDLLTNLSTPMFSIDVVDDLLVAFTATERRTTSTQTALFKLLGHTPIRSRLDVLSRAKILQTFFDSKNRPTDHAFKAQQALVAGLLKLKGDFACLHSDRNLFRTVAAYLAEHEKDPNKGKRKLFFDWLRETDEPDLLLDEVSWKDLDVVERLSVAGKGITSELESVFYERLIAPQLESPSAATLMKVAISSRNLARFAIESIQPETLMNLALPNSDPKKLRNDPPALLLHHTSKISFAMVVEAEKHRSAAEKQVLVIQSELEEEKNAHQQALLERISLENRVAELTQGLEYEKTGRRVALQTDIDLGRFDSIRELCSVHRSLLTASGLVQRPPAEFGDATRLAQSALEGLGVEFIGPVGQIVPRDLVLHESRSPKGSRVEIIQVGYIMKVSRAVLLPALAYPVDER